MYIRFASANRFLISMRLIPIFLLCLTCSLPGASSQDIESIKKDLAFYGDILMNAAATEHRQRADDSLSRYMERFLVYPGSFDTGLEDVPWVSVVQPDTPLFRIITWQVNKGDSSFSYKGYIQKHDGHYIRLTDQKSSNDREYAVFDEDNWYGSRYYRIKMFKHQNRLMYLLFGFNAHQRWNRQKLVDVLYFDDDKPTFGYSVFGKVGEDVDRRGKSRIILTYSLDSRVNLDYDENFGMITHDHLIPIQERFPGQGETMIADGSYVGYKINADGHWIYRDRLFDGSQSTPPDDGVDRSNQKKKDLFGRDKQ